MEAKLPDTGKAACASMRKETSWGKAWPGQGAHWLEPVDQQRPCQNLAQTVLASLDLGMPKGSQHLPFTMCLVGSEHPSFFHL